MLALDAYRIDDLKLIYRVLHAHLLEHTELMDSELFQGLQSYLQGKARGDGVELADHGQWDAWLGVPHTPCGERMKGRRTLS